MKILIEIQNNIVASISSTKDCKVFVVNHDKERDKQGEYYRPDCITLEDGKLTPKFDQIIKEAIGV